MSAPANQAPQPYRPPALAWLLLAASVVGLFVSINTSLLSWITGRAFAFTLALAPGLLLVLSSIGFGDLLVRRGSRALLPGERPLFAFACGLGILSTGAGILGLTGTMTPLGSAAFAAIGLFCGIPLWRDGLTRITACRQPQQGRLENLSSLHVLLGAVLAFAGVTIVAVSLTPPLLFDVTEYHLGAWTDYIRPDGNARFTPTPNNFYARFPFPIEAIYFLGLSSAPYFDSAPKLFNGACVLACGLLAGLLTRRFGFSNRAGRLAALVAITHPVMLDVSLDALIDAPTALLVAASLYACFIAGDLFHVRPVRENPGLRNSPEAALIIPAAFLFGTALAAKYTVAQVYLLPWCLLALPLLFRAGRRRPSLLFLSALLAAVPCALWLGKNVAFYSNPLEPFFVKWFRPGDATGIAREKFYIESHFPQSPLTVDYWLTLVPRLREFGWLLLIVCAGWMFRPRTSFVIRIIAFIVVAWLLWNTVRESQNRFLLPAMVMLSAVAVGGAMSFPRRSMRRFASLLLILFSLMQVTHHTLRLHESHVTEYLLDFFPATNDAAAESDNATPREMYYKENLGHLGEILSRMNSTLPKDSRVLMIYEARPYLFRQDTGYNVVWDDSLLLNVIRYARDVDHAWQLLKEAGYTHVLVNRQELLRYIQQYARPSQLRRLGVRPGDDPRAAWSLTQHPEDLYPPFYRDPEWPRLRQLVYKFLEDIDNRATLRTGLQSPVPTAQSLEITVSAVP